MYRVWFRRKTRMTRPREPAKEFLTPQGKFWQLDISDCRRRIVLLAATVSYYIDNNTWGGLNLGEWKPRRPGWKNSIYIMMSLGSGCYLVVERADSGGCGLSPRFPGCWRGPPRSPGCPGKAAHPRGCLPSRSRLTGWVRNTGGLQRQNTLTHCSRTNQKLTLSILCSI